MFQDILWNSAGNQRTNLSSDDDPRNREDHQAQDGVEHFTAVASLTAVASKPVSSNSLR